MKILITEQQYKLIEEEQKVLTLNFGTFGYDWDLLQKFLEKKGNPKYNLIGDLDFSGYKMEPFKNLNVVYGNLDLSHSKIESLGDLTYVSGYLDLYRSTIESLGELTTVGGGIYMAGSRISSFGKLKSVGGDLIVHDTPLSQNPTLVLRSKIKVGGEVSV